MKTPKPQTPKTMSSTLETARITIDLPDGSKYKFAKFAPKDPARYAMQNVQLLVHEGRLVATVSDGRMLLHLDLGETPKGWQDDIGGSQGILIPAKAWKEVLETGKEKEARSIELVLNDEGYLCEVVLRRGETMQSVKPAQGQFPLWSMLIDRTAEHEECPLAFSPALFAQACQFMASVALGHQAVKFTAKGTHAPITLSRSGSRHIAVVMSVTLA